MLARSTSKPEEASSTRNWASFLDDADRLLAALKEVQRAQVAFETANPGKPFAMEDRAREDLIKRYNDLVEESNDLEFTVATK